MKNLNISFVDKLPREIEDKMEKDVTDLKPEYVALSILNHTRSLSRGDE